MKIPRYFFIVLSILFVFNLNSQTCTPSFVYTLDPNGTLTLSNTSIPINSISPMTYSWYISNGMNYTTSTLSQTVSSSFTVNSNYYVQLVMRDDSLICYSSTTQTMAVQIAGCPLIANFSATNNINSSPVINFINQSTGTISTTSYTWEFGDGNTSNSPNPLSHTYAGNGIFIYTLTATNNPTCISVMKGNLTGYPPSFYTICSYPVSITHTINSQGVVNFGVNGIENFSNSVFVFTDHFSALNDLTPTHTYFNGTYRPYFGGNSGPCSYIDTLSPMTITNNPCYANSAFTFTAGSGGAVQFSISATSSFSNIAYLWNFGDGTSSSLTNLTHTYTNAGTYSARLLSYNTTYPLYNSNINSSYFYLPCSDTSGVTLPITGIPCIANSNFTIPPSISPHTYWIIPSYPYNVSAATWDWGDNTTSNGLYSYHTYTAAGTYDICLTVTTSCGSSSSFCSTQYLSKGTAGDMLYLTVMDPDIIAGVNESKMEEIQFSVFPNPSSGLLNVKVKKSVKIQKILVLDLLGKLVEEISIHEIDDTYKLDLSHLNNGLYFLQIKLPEKTMSSKFIISR